MKAVILAGGFGTRLRPLTFARPKHMLPIVDKPMLEHIIDYLDSFNVFEEIIISIGQQEEFKMIIDYFSKKRYAAKVNFLMEKQRMGGVGAIKYVLDNKEIDEPFLLYLGDNITDFNLKKMIALHKKHPAMATIALKENPEPWKYGVAVLKGDNILKFVEKPAIGKEPSRLISTGIYIFDSKIKSFLDYNFLDSTGMLFPLLLDSGHKINGYDIGKSFWVDVGRPASYLEATAYVLEKYKMDKWIEKGVEIGENTTFTGTVVVYNNGTKIGKNCFIKNSVILSNNSIGDDCHIVNSILDTDCRIGNGVHVSTTLGRGSVINKDFEDK
ncbi:MAG: NDP-sugar synthase [Candidatus Nanoarchaeia archaeon]|nr:NDP-sugar synthase [Candidatus Nanoarchaeia archaeon]